jgi:predicted O-linked N-acetylglucosamine transferase (SPINDLY family)
VRNDGIDILVDLAGHTGGNRLTAFARRPAPVQASWLGYIDTTGLAAVDYVVTDAHETPRGDERWFVEEVVRLPHGSMCYTPPPWTPQPAPQPPFERNGYVTFGCFNHLGKLNGKVLALWGRVLASVPDARLLLKGKPLGDPVIAEAMRRRCAEAGIDLARLELRPFSPHVAMLEEYGDMDVALDPFPYSGGLTSCEALYMGVPVLTRGGDRLVARQTVSFLHNIEATELIVADDDDLIARAVALAGDPARLAAYRRQLRPRMAASPLCDAPLFTRGLEAAFRAMWRAWCEGGRRAFKG